MSVFGSPVGLSQWVITKKIEQRFALIGFARLLKLVELVAERADPAAKAPSALVAWGDFMAALHCDSEAAGDFLAYCEQARVLDRGSEDGRLRLTLLGELAAWVRGPTTAAEAAPAREIFTRAEQWADWFGSDLSCPPYLAKDPYTLKIFARWCITNVAVDEVEAAVERAIKNGEAPQPAVLHDLLKVLRLERLSAVS